MDTEIRRKVRSAHITAEACGITLYAKLELYMTEDLTVRATAFKKRQENDRIELWK